MFRFRGVFIFICTCTFSETPWVIDVRSVVLFWSAQYLWGCLRCSTYCTPYLRFTFSIFLYNIGVCFTRVSLSCFVYCTPCRYSNTPKKKNSLTKLNWTQQTSTFHFLVQNLNKCNTITDTIKLTARFWYLFPKYVWITGQNLHHEMPQTYTSSLSRCINFCMEEISVETKHVKTSQLIPWI